MRSIFRGSAPFLLIAAASCASGGSSPSVTQEAATGQLGPAFLQWTGKFKSTHQQPGDLTARTLNIASGSVVLTAPDENRTRVQMSVSGPVQESQSLRWALAPGACRSGTIPVMPVNTFPQIRFSNGHGELDEIIPVTFPISGAYHVNVYTGDGADESDVLTCSELKLGRK